MRLLFVVTSLYTNVMQIELVHRTSAFGVDNRVSRACDALNEWKSRTVSNRTAAPRLSFGFTMKVQHAAFRFFCAVLVASAAFLHATAAQAAVLVSNIGQSATS